MASQIYAYYASTPSQHEQQPAQPHAHRFSSALPAVAVKSAFLSALRAGLTGLQGEVNAFLTSRMQADETAAGQAKSGTVKGKAGRGEDEEMAEQMYGEEEGGEGE